jgi:predicted metalloendopeptidase
MRTSFPLLTLALLAAAPAGRADVTPANFDLAVKPQDNFYLYVNGSYLRNTPIPPAYSSWGSHAELQDRNQQALHTLAEQAAAKGAQGTPVERLVGDFYASGMDEAAANAAGAAPLRDYLALIAAVQKPADVLAVLAQLHAAGLSAGFGLGADPDIKNSAFMLARLETTGALGLPERGYYFAEDEKSEKIRQQYVAHVARMLVLLGDAPEAARTGATAVMALETKLAQGMLPRVKLRDPHATYHKLPLAEAGAQAPGIDWSAYLAATGAPAFTEVNLTQPEFFRAFAAALNTVAPADWRAYLRWHLVDATAPYLGEAFVRESFEFRGRTLTGQQQLRERWQRVIGVIDGNIGEALGQLYVAAYFPPEAKARMARLVANLRAALAERIATLEWMDAPTKAKALVKLEAFHAKIGYPDRWRDYGALTVDRGPYVLNVLRAKAFEHRRRLAQIGGPVARAEWEMSPPTVNAYFSPERNEIVFPAGYLQPPFFDPQGDDAPNYGGIGTSIGHEMTHGFDDEGRQFDGQGNLVDWWTPASAENFKQRAAGVVRQFSAYTVLDGLHINGELTQGENIADLGGVRVAYAALQKALAGQPREKIDGFTPEQRFFISWAAKWRRNSRPEALRLQVNTDPHSPAEFRANGPLSNLDEFARAFDVPEGAPMRRPAAERVTIW